MREGSPSAAASPATRATSVSWTSARSTVKTGAPVPLPHLVRLQQDWSFPILAQPSQVWSFPSSGRCLTSPLLLPQHPLPLAFASLGSLQALLQAQVVPNTTVPFKIPLPPGMPTCRCPTGFTGPKCTQQMCAGYCANNSTCSVNQGNQPQCRCLPGFLGDRCQYRE